MSDINGRYRRIHVLIWNDDKFPFLSEQSKLVYFHLLTTPMGNQFGCFKGGICSLAEEARIPPESYSKSFDELTYNGFLNHDRMVMVTKLKSFLKYNEPHNPNVLRSWGKVFNELPNCELKSNTYAELMIICKSKKKSFVESLKESFNKPTFNRTCNQDKTILEIQEQEQEQEHNNSQEESNYTYDQDNPFGGEE